MVSQCSIHKVQRQSIPFGVDCRCFSMTLYSGITPRVVGRMRTMHYALFHHLLSVVDVEATAGMGDDASLKVVVSGIRAGLPSLDVLDGCL